MRRNRDDLLLVMDKHYFGLWRPYKQTKAYHLTKLPHAVRLSKSKAAQAATVLHHVDKTYKGCKLTWQAQAHAAIVGYMRLWRPNAEAVTDADLWATFPYYIRFDATREELETLVAWLRILFTTMPQRPDGPRVQLGKNTIPKYWEMETKH